MTRDYKTPVTLFLLSLALWSMGGWWVFKRAQTSAELRTKRLTSLALARVLEHAHKMNDDLTLQEAIQGMAQAPGVYFACVLNQDRKILAHTEPAWLGKSYDAMVHHLRHPLLWTYTLRNRTIPWGTLVLSISKRSDRTQTLHYLWVLATGLTLIMGMLYWILKTCDHRFHRDQELLAALEFKNQELAQEATQLKKHQETTGSAADLWVQQVFEKLPSPTILLDERQQLRVWNQAAAERMGSLTTSSPSGRSWQDLPLLNQLGPRLQESLENPGHIISVQFEGNHLEFLTESNHTTSSTWITFK